MNRIPAIAPHGFVGEIGGDQNGVPVDRHIAVDERDVPFEEGSPVEALVAASPRKHDDREPWRSLLRIAPDERHDEVENPVIVDVAPDEIRMVDPIEMHDVAVPFPGHPPIRVDCGTQIRMGLNELLDRLLLGRRQEAARSDRLDPISSGGRLHRPVRGTRRRRSAARRNSAREHDRRHQRSVDRTARAARERPHSRILKQRMCRGFRSTALTRDAESILLMLRRLAAEVSKGREEKDSLGVRSIPHEAYWGAQTSRAIENYPISGERAHPELILAYARIKKACAMTNEAVGRLDRRKTEAITRACDEILGGQHRDQFVVDVYQAGAGTSFHMNVNEVIAGRAAEILGAPRGDRGSVNPNDDVNLGQSTNDTFPTALHMAAIAVGRRLSDEIGRLAAAFEK